MKTSWNDTMLIEQYLSGNLNNENKAFFEVRLLLEPQLAESLKWQQKTYAVTKQYGRQKLRDEIEQVSHHVFTANKYINFRKKVLILFG